MKHLTRLALVLAFTLASASAFASTVTTSHAGAACNEATEGAIKQRPLLADNVGSTTEFLTCSFDNAVNARTDAFQVLLYNGGDTDAVVSCTLVLGVAGGAADYLPRSVVVGAHNAAPVTWSYASDNGGQPWTANASASCGLLPGTGVSGVARQVR